MTKLLLTLALWPSLTFAEPRFGLGVGVSFYANGKIDLAEVAGNDDYGRQSDSSPGELGLLFTGRFLPVDTLELGLTGSLAVGGLSLNGVEDRYVGQRDHVGSALAVDLRLHSAWCPQVADALSLLVGGGLGVHQQVANSGVITSGLRSLYGSALLGLRRGLTEHSHLELMVDARLNFSQAVKVEVGDRTLFEDPDSPSPFPSLGTSLSYLYLF